MKRLWIVVFSLALAAPAAGAVVEHTYTFDSPRVVERDGYNLLLFDDTFQAGTPGGPMVPWKAVELLLPPGDGVASFEFERKGPVTLEAPLRLYPQQPVRPIDLGPSGEFAIDPVAYGSRTPVPAAESFRLVNGFANGLSIAAGTFTPVSYVPASGSVTWYREVTVRVETRPSSEAARALDNLPTSGRVLAKAGARVDNSEALGAYAPRPATKTGEYDYLIITKATYADDFGPLAAHYVRRGIRTAIHTVEDIDAAYSGVDLAAEIRAHITDEYQDHGVQWVLLGGDADGSPASSTGKVVPFRGLYCRVQSSIIYIDEAIPSDCYFAGLDGTWNADGDSKWGEPGEEDLYGEVHVGRAPFDSEAEIANFVTKTIRYEDEPVTGDARKVLLAGELLYDDPETWGDDHMEELIGTCTHNGYTTTGIPASYPITKLYERTGWEASDLMSAVNAGIHQIHHLGHSNTWYNMKLNDDDVTDQNFTNDGVTHGYVVVYTQGCLCGAFDNFYGGDYYSTECIGEKMLTVEHFAVAVFANSRYGWFTEGTTNGPGQHLHREYVDALFGDGLHTIGEAGTRSKTETAPFVDLPDEYEPGAHRWNFYCSNLLGDPVLDVWTDTPGALTVSAPETVDRNAAGVTVETGLEGALVGLSWGGVLYGRALVGTGGTAEVTFAAPIASLDTLEVVVTAHNRLPWEGHILVTDMASVADAGPAPSDWALWPSTPNPFASETAIRFSVRSESEVSVRVFDVTGRTVARLVNGRRAAGEYRVTWAPDADLSPGIYFCELRAGEYRSVKKILRVK